MRPRNRRLVDKVGQYVKRRHGVDDISQVLGELSDSYELRQQPITVFEKEDAVADQRKPFKFQYHGDYISCACRTFPSRRQLLPVIMLVIVITVTALLWYANVPVVSRHIQSDTNLKNAGTYIIIAECIVFIGGYVLWICCRRKARYGYKHFENNPSIQDQAVVPHQLHATYDSTVSMVEPSPTTVNGQTTHGEGSEPRPYRTSESNYGSYSGAESLACSSYAPGLENVSP